MRIKVFCLTLLLVAATSLVFGAEITRQAIPPLGENVYVIHVHYTQAQQKGDLVSRLLILDSPPGQDYMVALATAEQISQLTGEGYEVSVDSETTRTLRTTEQYPCYRTPGTIEADLKTYAEKYPDLVQLTDIGDSWEKINLPGESSGYDIWMLQMTNNATAEPKPAFFLMGNIHGNEMISAEAVMEFIDLLLTGYGKNPDATWILDNRVVYAVPMVNPDGRMKTEQDGQYVYWRKNANSEDGCDLITSSGYNHYGVDLNRNFGSNWAGPGTSGAPCQYSFHGSAAESEPETQSITNVLRQIFPDRDDTTGLLITLHSAARYIVWPWGNGYHLYGGLLPKDLPGLTALGQRFAQDNGYIAMMADDWYPAAGATEDWSYEELDIAGYTFELGTLQPNPCDEVEEEIAINLPAFIYAAKATGPDPYEVVRGPEMAGLKLNTWWVSGNPGETASITATADDTNNGWLADPSFPDIVPDRGRPVAAGELTIPVVKLVPAEDQSKGETPELADEGTVDDQNATQKYVEVIESDTSTLVTALDGAFDNATEALSATFTVEGLTPGRHLVSLRAQDDLSHWGAKSSTFLTVAPALAGWWHQPSDAGIGISVELGPNIAYIALAAYDVDGSPAWWSSVAIRDGDNTWSGDLYRYSGTGISRETARLESQLAGDLTLTLTGYRTANLTWSIDGVPGEKSLVTFLEDYSSGVYAYSEDNGWWLVDGVDGAGVFVEVQNETLYAALYHYNSEGQPQWWSLGADFGGFPEGSTEYTGDMVAWQGGETMDGLGGETVTAVNHGEAKLSFLGDNKARLEWGENAFNLTRFDLSNL